MSEPSTPKPPTKTEWYGLTTLAVDGGAIAITGIGLVAPARSGPTGILVGTGLIAYALGGPIVHVAKGEALTAFGSLALRVGIMTPVVAVAAVAPKSTAIVTALLAAQVLAASIDAAGLAYRQVPVTPSLQAWHQYLPNVAMDRQSATLLFSGQF